MAAPTPVTKSFWNGNRGMTRWYAAWTDGTQLTDSVVVDVSALSESPTAVKIRSIDIHVNGNLQVDLEFDATTDELIDRFIGQSDQTNPLYRDYTDGPSSAWSPTQSAVGFAGDVLLTSVGAANGDEINLLVVYDKAT